MALFIQFGALEEYGFAARFQDAKYTVSPYFGKWCPLETSIGIRQSLNCAVVQTGKKRRVSLVVAFPGLGIQENSGYHIGHSDSAHQCHYQETRQRKSQGVQRMSQPASDATAAAYRRKTYAKLIIFVILMLFVWLQPKIQTWLENRKVGGPGGSDVVANNDSATTGTSQIPANRSRVVIRDVDEPVVAEVDRTESKSSTATPPETSQTKDTPALGELREIRNNVFESTAGLRYVPGSADGHRLRHVMKHAKDDLSKPKHGVFDGDGDRDQILAVIDEAYDKAKKGGKDVRKSEEGARTVYIINLGRKIGYVGGSSGERSGNPDCRYVQLVLEVDNVVITAYPTRSF